jgi:uncharacterized protein (DUF924 family)
MAGRLSSREVLNFWYAGVSRLALRKISAPSNAQNSLWFGGKSRDNETIRNMFSNHLAAVSAANEKRDMPVVDGVSLSELAGDLLANIITLDQFSRVIYRKSARAFENDTKALSLANFVIDTPDLAADLAPLERLFVEMPLMHSEDISAHKKLLALRNVDADSIDIEAEHTDFAVKHFAIIAKFGRYPYRNQVLGRENTPEEQIWLDNGAETFGQ